MLSRKFTIRYLLYAFSFLCVVSMQGFGLLTSAQNFLSETRSKYSQRQASGQVVLIGIDKKSIDQVGVWPWPRSVYAKAIHQLIKHQAADIAFDVDFSTPSTPIEDEALAKALRGAGGSVILPTFLQTGSADAKSNSVANSKPLSQFAEAAWTASVNVNPDTDGLIRSYTFGNIVESELVPSLSNLISGNAEINSSSFHIDFSIQPSSVPIFSFADLLSGKLPNGALTDKTVLIGAHALELRDNLAVPVHGAMMGPMLHIVAAETLLQDRQLAFTGLGTVLILLLLSSVAVILVFRHLRLKQKLFGLLAIVICIEFVGFVLQAQFAIVLTSVPFLLLAIVGAIVFSSADIDIKSWLLRIAKFEVHNTKALLSQVFSDSSDAILIVDEKGTFVEMNEQFKALLLFPQEPLASTSSLHVIPKQLADDAQLAIQNAKLKNSSTVKSGQLKLASATGDLYFEYSVTASKILDPKNNTADEESSSFIACVTARDVTVPIRQKQMLQWQSKHDTLTGTERRFEFLSCLSREFDIRNSSSEPIHVFALGIHRFHGVNSTLGREIGNGLLKAFAKRLESADRLIEGVSRLDGASFAVRVKSGLSDEEADEFAHRLLAHMDESYDVDGQKINIDVCIGVAGIAVGSDDAKKLLEHAEFALEEAISIGPNTVQDFNPKLNVKQLKARRIEREMENGLACGQFYLQYQPQVTTQDGLPSGAESLIRWEHPELGKISPDEFVEIAETNGFIDKLGRFALHEACQAAVSWPQHTTVAINVSPLQFIRGDIVADVKAALETSGLNPNRLELEITESCFLNNSSDLLNKMAALKELGVSLSLDDFGTGYSSLGYFNKYPLDKIKVDRVFVTGIESKNTNRSILHSIKVLADGLGIKVLCEGVETDDELRILRQLGCDQIQGYYFGKPQSQTEITEYFCMSRKAVA